MSAIYQVIERRLEHAKELTERSWADWKGTREQSALHAYARRLRRENRLRFMLADMLIHRVDELIAKNS